MIPNPTLNNSPNASSANYYSYTSPNTTGILAYTPVAGVFGTSVITVQVLDSGGTANGGVNRPRRSTFTVTVNQINQTPTLAAIGDRSIPENSLAAVATSP